MDSSRLANIAMAVVADFRREREGTIDEGGARELTVAIEAALLAAIRGERRTCAEECSRRAALWEGTAERMATPERLRQEALHRGNEARYLADTLAAGGVSPES